VFEPTPWETAQAEWVGLSLKLASELGSGLKTAGIPVVLGRAVVRPLDNMTCPAVAVEVAPLAVEGGDAAPVSDAGYQQRVAATLALALQSWRGHAEAEAAALTGRVGAGGTP
jgi:N-acetylmuramoyl-L-alanine amidase